MSEDRKVDDPIAEAEALLRESTGYCDVDLHGTPRNIYTTERQKSAKQLAREAARSQIDGDETTP